MIITSLAVDGGTVPGWQLDFPRKFLSGNSTTIGDAGSTDILWANQNNHNISFRGIELLNSYWFVTAPAIWECQTNWDWHSGYLEPLATLNFSMVGSDGIPNYLIGQYVFDTSSGPGILWRQSNMLNDSHISITPNLYDTTSSFCGIEAHLNCWYSNAAPPRIWTKGDRDVPIMGVNVTGTKIILQRYDQWAVQRSNTAANWEGIGSTNTYNWSNYFTTPLYTPPAFADVTRPWYRWQFGLWSYATPTITAIDVVIASGQISHTDWLRKDIGGINNWACYNSNTHVISNPYSELAAHGYLPPYPSHIYLYYSYS